jgi:phosphoglucosamine mutase
MSGIPVNRMIAFGTDGIRGNAEQFPFTDDALYDFGRALAVWAQQKYNKSMPKILIGMDTRISGPRIKEALCRGLVDGGIRVLDTGVLPTPAVCQIIFYDKSFDAGIVISASHNPYHDNGVKIFDARRCKITSEDEQVILKHFESYLAGEGISLTHKGSVELWTEAIDIYQKKIISLFPAHFLKKVKVVLDCAHGATYQVAPIIFKALGADVTAIAAQPSGLNINDNCGALHPEALAQAVKDLHADVGFAFDGDGDRIIGVSRNGLVKDGDDILALLLDLPVYKSLPTVVGTVMTNQGFENHFVSRGKAVIRAKVGDKYVAAKLEEENVPLGGEISGHIIIKDYLTTGDGVFVALKVLESMIVNDNFDMNTFAKFPQVLINVPVVHKKDLTQHPYSLIIAEYEKKLGQGRILVRYSGTEHLLRVMTEATTHEVAQTVAQALATRLQEALKANS